jgi:hypothetical protein
VLFGATAILATVAAVAAVGPVGCNLPPPGGASDGGPPPLHVLFIGNSYTYVNDLPGMLSRIAATAGIPPAITTDEVVQGAATLQVHWNNGIAQTRIAQGGFTHVVLQGQSQEPLFDDPDFVTYAQKFTDLIAQAGARPTLFVTWARAAGDPSYDPSKGGTFVSPGEMQDELTAAYDDLARQSPTDLLACAGEAFRQSIAQYPNLVLQQSDFSHPTVAGTYLAACTFYVALTGQPVPVQSEVPAGLDPQDAAHLRAIALVGSNCADVKPKAAVAVGDSPLILQFSQAVSSTPFDYGTAGTPIINYFALRNTGLGTAGLADGATLAPPFVWGDGTGFPGGSGSLTLQGQSWSFCSATLAPNATCLLGVSYGGAGGDGVPAGGTLTVNLANAYETNVTRTLTGTATSRALVTVSESSGFFGCTDTSCGAASMWAYPTESTPYSLILTNRGSLPTTALAEGTPLAPPFYWGPSGTTDAFPGGTGIGGVDGQYYPYCTSPTLGPGQQCMVTVNLGPVSGCGPWVGAVNVAYADAEGAVTPNANRNLQGSVPLPSPPGGGK